MIASQQNRTKRRSALAGVEWRYHALKGKNLYCVYTLRRLTTGKCMEQLNGRFPGHENSYVLLGRLNRALYLLFGMAVVVLGPLETKRLEMSHA